MKKYSILLLILVFATGAFAQKDDNQKKNDKEKEKTSAVAAVAISKNSTPMELARAAVAAHGGDKFKNMKTLSVLGTTEVSGSPTQVMSGSFAMIYSGEKYRLEIILPIQAFKQVYDGDQTSSSMPNFQLPPLNRLGFPLLPKIEEKGYAITELPDKSKKLGFRVTSPEGYYTDFFVDEKTGQVKSYSSKYDSNGREITTSVEIDKLRDVEGVLIPEKYSQRFEFGQVTMYANFKAKEILVNSAIADDVFTLK